MVGIEHEEHNKIPAANRCCVRVVQTRQDLHRRHVREREALETQAAALQQHIQSLQAAEKNKKSDTNAAADSASQVIPRLLSEPENSNKAP